MSGLQKVAEGGQMDANPEMTFDELLQKFRNIEQKCDDQFLKEIKEEFGSLEDLAFGILESILHDRSKYSYLCFVMTDEGEYAIGNGKANKLLKKLAEFKKEFKKQKHE
jgi:hypothetical protein